MNRRGRGELNERRLFAAAVKQPADLRCVGAIDERHDHEGQARDVDCAEDYVQILGTRPA
jgi:hypothetical protein